MHLIFKRILAFVIDLVVIVLYALVLFAIMMILSQTGIVTLGTVHPLTGQLIGFCTLTLPVILYFIVFEAGQRHATLGKRILKIEVTGDEITAGQIILRNIIKFLPWEFAHAGVLWINYIKTPETPLWLWVLLIAPQIVVIVYVMSAVATKGSRSLYDMISGTRVRHVVNHLPIILPALVLQTIGESFIQ
jgi:uncharacterized RDD family membrane protein YckC